MKYDIVSTRTFDKWLKGLKDRQTRNRILARLQRVQNGHFGDFKPLGSDILELRFSFGGGLRIYYAIRNNQIVLLLNGGRKSTQSQDIDKAKQIFQELEHQP